MGQGGGQLGTGHGGLTYLPDLLNISCSSSSSSNHLHHLSSNSPSRSGSPPHLSSLPLPGIETFTQDGSVIHVSEVHQVKTSIFLLHKAVQNCRRCRSNLSKILFHHETFQDFLTPLTSLPSWSPPPSDPGPPPPILQVRYPSAHPPCNTSFLPLSK